MTENVKSSEIKLLGYFLDNLGNVESVGRFTLAIIAQYCMMFRRRLGKILNLYYYLLLLRVAVLTDCYA